MSSHHEKLFMVVKPLDPLSGFYSLIYEVGTTEKEVWNKIINNETMGSLQTKESLKAQGYRARQIKVLVSHK